LSDDSNFRNKALNLLLALFRLTALPTFLEVTNATLRLLELPLKKVMKELLCHFLLLAYIRLKSLELLIL